MSDPYGQPQPVQPQPVPPQPGSAPAYAPQPGYVPASGYAPQPEQWSSTAAAPAPAVSGGGSPLLANVSFVIGLVLVLLGAIFMLLFPLYYRLDDPYTAIDIAQFVNGGLTAVLGLAAAVTGAIAIVRGGRGRGRARASAGLVLGASSLVTLLVSLLQGIMFQFL